VKTVNEKKVELPGYDDSCFVSKRQTGSNVDNGEFFAWAMETVIL
jgi:hypothetical protein